MKGVSAATARLLPAVLLGAALLGACAAPRDPACPAAQDLPPEALYGRWEARFDGQPTAAVVELAAHPDYAGVRGTIARAGTGARPATVAQLAGDLGDDGTLAIDESLDGRSISGVWVGTMAPGACGRVFQGTWRDAADESTHAFVLTKTDEAKKKEAFEGRGK